MERYLKVVLGSNKFEGVQIARSKTMSAIRGKGNKSTEIALRMALVRFGISGWQLHRKDVPGKPDFFFSTERVAIFVDGCFWHGCPKCSHIPLTRSEFWAAKFERNRARDKRVVRQLKAKGISVIRLWEHQLKSKKGMEIALRHVRVRLDRSNHEE